MLEVLTKFKEIVLDILIPKSCLGCGKERKYICDKCEVFLSEVNMMGLGDQSHIMSVWEYEGLMEKLIWKIKYDGMYDIISELVEKAFLKIELNLPADTYITYVPMYKKRQRERGFNQAELIAKKVGEITKREVVPLLTKKKDNKSQVGLNPKERIENVSGVFAAATLSKVQPYSILLVDDVYTTGATMAECIKTLKKAGVKKVWGFTLARKMSLYNI